MNFRDADSGFRTAREEFFDRESVQHWPLSVSAPKSPDVRTSWCNAISIKERPDSRIADMRLGGVMFLLAACALLVMIFADKKSQGEHTRRTFAVERDESLASATLKVPSSLAWHRPKSFYGIYFSCE